MNGFEEIMDIFDRKRKTAIEKQIGKHPVLLVEDGKMSGLVCSICGKSVALCEKYCDRCGQKIDWRRIRD